MPHNDPMQAAHDKGYAKMKEAERGDSYKSEHLKRISIEVADNGYIIECSYERPSGNKVGSMDFKTVRKVAPDKKSLLTILDSKLGAL